MRRLLVKAAVFVEVEVPDDAPDGYDAHFDIVENHCPCTGVVGAAIEKEIERATTAGVCWACNLRGTNEIVSSLPVQDEPHQGEPEANEADEKSDRPC